MIKRLTGLLLAAVIILGVMSTAIVSASAESKMVTSDECLAILEEEEGFSAKPYWDHTQYTVGYGTRCPDDMLDYYMEHGITKKEAEVLLRNHLSSVELDINKYIIEGYSLSLTQSQFDALVLFSYNCGTGWVYDNNGTLNKALKAGATGNDIIRAFALWCNAGGQVQENLLRRRLTEANMFLNGEYSVTPPDNYCYVLYDANGGTVSPRSQGYDSENPVKPFSTPTYPGYTFAGWYTKRTGGTKVTKLTASVKNKALYAHWLDTDGNVLVPEQISVKVTVNTDDVNLREGPGTSYAIVGTANTGDKLTITETTYNGTLHWGKFDGGWICLQYTDFDTASQEPAKLAITTQPAAKTVSVGSKAKFTVIATGSGLTYQWQYRASSSGSWSSSSHSGNKTATLTVATKAHNHGYQYRCKITDKNGEVVYTKAAKLTVKPAITTQPKNVTVSNGSTAKTTVEAAGNGLTYTWYYKNKGASKFTLSSKTGNSYSVIMNSARNSRKVYCVIEDKYGNQVTTKTVTLTMKQVATITTQPKNVTVTKGSTAKTTVKATGDGLTYTWYYKNKGANKFTLSSQTDSSYSVIMNSARNGRKVYCVIEDKYGNQVTTKTVTLTMKQVATITTQPKNVTVTKGSTAKATVKATGDGLTYTWYYKNKGASKFTLSSKTGNTYSVIMNSARNGRQVYCVVKDKYGNSVKSTVVTLKMK